MYCTNTKRFSRFQHFSDRRHQPRRLGVREVLRLIRRPLETTVHRIWEYRLFAGLARLAATGVGICRASGSEPGEERERSEGRAA